MNQSPIALMTDFGLEDPYVGILKGVILGINPSALIIDLGHDLNPGDIPSAAFGLYMAFPYFPKGTVFVVVVDPGVGTIRRALAVEIEGKYIVCPDNGILSWVVRDYGSGAAVELTNPKYFLNEVSSTFHGRDVFAPVAAHISKGVPLEELGPKAENMIARAIPDIHQTAGSIRGEVVYVDRFGNLLTNITRQQFTQWLESVPTKGIRVEMGSVDIGPIRETYGDVALGHTVALFGSSGVLEIAINRDKAADSLGATTGTPVSIYRMQD